MHRHHFLHDYFSVNHIILGKWSNRRVLKWLRGEGTLMITVMITRNDTLMITRGGYFDDYEGKVL